MAVVRAFQPFRMDALGITLGEGIEASQSRIIIAAGPQLFIYGGVFQYDSFGQVFGTLTSFEIRVNNVTTLRIDQFSANANDAFRAVEILGDAVLLAELILASNDTLLGSSGNDFLFAHTGSDFLDGGDGDDVLLGESGNDTFVGGSGNDTLIGGTGIDTAFINATFRNHRVGR
jgi:Ca2+-binding RTX toxin-like protein